MQPVLFKIHDNGLGPNLYFGKEMAWKVTKGIRLIALEQIKGHEFSTSDQKGLLGSCWGEGMAWESTW